MNPAPNRGQEGARSYLEDTRVIRSQPGQKRKHAGDGGARSDHQKRASSTFTSESSTPSSWKTPTKPVPTPEFKRPQPLQRERRRALKSGIANEKQSGEGTPGKRRRTESLSTSPRIPSMDLAVPASSSSTTFSSGGLSSTLSSKDVSHQKTPNHGADHTPTPSSRTPKYKPRESPSSVTGTFVELSALQTEFRKPRSHSARFLSHITHPLSRMLDEIERRTPQESKSAGMEINSLVPTTSTSRR